MAEIDKTITQDIESLFQTQTENVIAKDFLLFQSRIQTMLNKIKNFSNEVALLSSQLERHDDGSISGSAVIRNLKQTQAFSQWDKQISQLLIDGSILIQELRTFLTGETLRYQIAIMYYGNIYEFEVPESELLKHVNISYATKRTDFSKLFTLKLGAKGFGKGSLIKEWQSFQVSSGTGKMSTQNVFKSFLKNKNIGTKNLGNIYEATKKYQYQKGRKSQSDVFSSITSNIISSTKGGDFDNIQYKFFGRSSPTLADMSVIVNTLEACQSLFTIAPIEMGAKIREIFVKDRSQVDSKIEQASLKEIDKHIDQLLQSIKF